MCDALARPKRLVSRPDHTIERITLRFDDERPRIAGDVNAPVTQSSSLGACRHTDNPRVSRLLRPGVWILQEPQVSEVRGPVV